MVLLWSGAALGQTVGDEVDAGGCWTGVVRALTDQLIDQINCLYPGTLGSFEEDGQVSFATSAVVPSLQEDARDALAAALDERPNADLVVNSVLRSLPQQYLLYQWYLDGQCGIQIAARPGHSNHEGGLAIDVDDHAAWRDALEQHGWEWYGSGDVVHFTYVAGGEDIRSASVLAFQTLWNQNHPEDPIAEDGQYGDETEGRLGLAPVDGFAVAGSCLDCERGTKARLDRVVAPGEVLVGEAVDVAATFTNTGASTWVAGEVWLDGERPVPLGADVIAGDAVTLVGRWSVLDEGPLRIALRLVDANGAPLEAGCDGEAEGSAEVVGVDRLPADPDDPDGDDEGDPTQQHDQEQQDDDDATPSGHAPGDDPSFERPAGDDGGAGLGSGCALAGGPTEGAGAPAWLLVLGVGQHWVRRRRSTTRQPTSDERVTPRGFR